MSRKNPTEAPVVSVDRPDNGHGTSDHDVPADPKKLRHERLRAALRANLRRRKGNGS